MSEENSQSAEVKEPELSKEVLDSSYPLLQKFRDLCPGSFKHSQALADMVEGVSIALGIDATFMKILALYHDVGKMMNPSYFTENQLEGEDPHEKLEPFISYQIISRHISDTAMILLNDENFPRDLIRITSQHHGTSVMRYFFDKSGSDVDEHFRYKADKPKCVQSAILMICDCIEARSRSEINAGKTHMDPKDVIEDTINYLLTDGQLDEVYMKLGDLKKIKEALAKELQGIYQKRVDYSEAKKESKES